jgi:hypothetical protein
MVRKVGMFVVLLFATLPGCAPERDAAYDQNNQLWLQGYGFKNPNPDRAKKGQPLLNFDGTEAK